MHAAICDRMHVLTEDTTLVSIVLLKKHGLSATGEEKPIPEIRHKANKFILR
jgi:hypothetical protein